MFALFLKNSLGVSYSLSGYVLTVSGNGEIIRNDVIHSGDYKTFTKIIIKNGPSKIGNKAFGECRRLEYISIPESVLSMDNPFYRCEKLSKIVVDNNNPNFWTDSNGVLYTKDKKKLIRAPTKQNLVFLDTLTEIDHSAFGTERAFNYGDIVFPSAVSTLNQDSFNEAKFGTISFNSASSLLVLNGFSYSRVTQLTIPKSVTQIKAGAFFGAIFDRIYFETDSVITEIGQQAFEEFIIYANQIILPNNVEKISDNAFRNSMFKKIIIGQKCSSISDSAFKGCVNLNDVSVAKENGFYSSVDGVIMNKDNTQIIFIPPARNSYEITPSINKIAVSALQMSNLTVITVDAGNNIWSAANGVLYSKNFETLVAVCGGVTSVVAHEKVKTIDAYAAKGCTKLTSFTFNKSPVTTIKINAFSESGLTSFELPSTVTTIENYTFWKTNSLTKFTIKDDSQLSEFSFRQFSYSSITSIYIPKLVTKIWDDCFYRCENLITVTLHPQSKLEIIKDSAFYCTIIEGIKPPKTLKTIESYAFFSCYNIKELIFEEGSQLETIGVEAFIDCTNLSKVVLPISCISIGHSSFRNDVSLTVFEHSLTTIESSSFENCKSLLNFNISSKQVKVNPSVFKGCEHLKRYHVETNSNLKDSYGCVFNNDETILYLFPPGEEEAIISTKTVEFADNAFAWSSKLRIVGFYSGSQLKTIGNSAFLDCKRLTMIQFAQQIQIIEANAFSGCSSLYKINLPNYLTTIGENAFRGCTALKEIKYCGTNEINNENVFEFKGMVSVTDFYPGESFCTLKVNKVLTIDCKLKPSLEKTCLCKRRRIDNYISVVLLTNLILK